MSRAVVLACAAAVAWPAVTLAEPAAAPGPASPTAPRKPAGPRKLYFRAGGAVVAPASSSRELELADIEGVSSLALQNGPIAGSGASIDSIAIAAAIVGYVLPTESRRWSIETVLGLPFTVKFRATGTLANKSIAPTALGIPTGVPALGSEIGEAKAVPPVVTAVYQLTTRGVLRPYVGAGASVMFTYDAHATNPMLTAVGEPEMSISPAPGLVLQGGLDARIWNNLYARFDVKFIGLMKANAEVRHIQVETPSLPLFESAEVGTAKMSVTVNPFIVTAGVGMDF